MKAFGKILGLVLLGLLLIIVALGFALTHLFDPNDYKEEIRQIARDKAHIELTLNGDIGWSLFPWLGLELHEASVATLTTPDPALRRPSDARPVSTRIAAAAPRSADERRACRRPQPAPQPRQAGSRQLGRHRQDPTGSQHRLRPPRPPARNPPSPGQASRSRPADPPGHRQPDGQQRPQVEYNDEHSGKQFSAESIQLSAGAVHEGASIPAN